MVNPASAIDQPRVTVVEVNDLTIRSADVELIDQDAVQLQSMPLRVRKVIVRLESASVVFQSTNVRVRTRTRTREGLLAYVTFGRLTRGTVNGLPVRPDLMLAAQPETEASFVAEGGWESITFLLPAQDISAHLTTRQREREFRLPRGVETLQVSAGKVRSLFDWGKRLVDTAEKQPSLFDERRSERCAAEAELLETLLAALSVANDFEPDRGDRTRQAYSFIVKIVEDHALARTGDRLNVTDLCRVAAVSERTLQYAFKEVMGLTPLTYLIRLRLNRVRQALVAATHGSTTVSAEALKWGFWHFGEFSRAYKACFGEAPSDTLRRKPVEPRG
jgi:AraC-like DNA-binding protein